jgi:hypothetical protein
VLFVDRLDELVTRENEDVVKIGFCVKVGIRVDHTGTPRVRIKQLTHTNK